MSFLRKILFFLMLGVFIGDSKGVSPTLDFNGISSVRVPSCFQSYIYNAPVAGQLPDRLHNGEKYVCFNVNPASGGNISQNVQADNVNSRNPEQGENNIYFPTDGSQPTTEDAVKWSCANVDNREDSLITEWYMKMFGVIPFQGNDYIEAGWKNLKWRNIQGGSGFSPSITRIISFNANVNDTSVTDPGIPNAFISRSALFKREFRKIASTSVGRVLLYRILIEIRRHQENNEGCTESPIVLSASDVFVRNTCRNLRIVYRDGDFAFRPQGELAFSNAIADETVIGSAVRDTGYSKVILCPDTVSVSLFHEMLHWYHHLRNVDRMNKEAGRVTKPHFHTHFLGKYYWGGLNSCANEWRGRLVSEQPWLAFSVIFGPADYVNFEELRTVLGVTYRGSIDQYQQNYLQGDDLSENLYRMCIGIPLRFGYGRDCFYEDTKVIDRVVNSCLKNFLLYSKAHEPEDFNVRRSGLGKSRFP